MKIAHFGIFSPHQSGQYGTIKDLIKCERMVGIDAAFIDYGFEGKQESREGLVDGDIMTKPVSWALDADVAIRHSAIPSEVKCKKIAALHGRPENSFRLEQYDIAPVISSVRRMALSGEYSALITFWEDYKFYWKWITGVDINYIPAPVDFDTYTPEGEQYSFNKDDINIIIMDMWREDNIPFNLIFAAQYFKDRYYPNTKLHLFGVDGVKKNKCYSFLSQLQKSGVVGQISGVIRDVAKIYRSADIILTPNIIATRVIREAMASGLPIVAPEGCKYTPFTAEPRDYKAFALQIRDCYENITPDAKKQIREKALRLFNNKITGNAIKSLCLEIKDKPVFNGMSITQEDWDCLEKFIKDYNIQKIIEFGPGVSTELFTKLGCYVTAYETDAKWYEVITKKYQNVETRLWNGRDIVSIPGNNDLVFIDAPHKSIGREFAYKSAYESDAIYIACHDTHRKDEQELVKKYFGDCEIVAQTQYMQILKRG